MLKSKNIKSKISEIRENICYIKENELCQGCGTCQFVCPIKAISMKIDENKGIYVPCVNDFLCNNCGLCLKVCPVKGLDHNKYIINCNSNGLIGNYIGCYAGYSSDNDVRYRGASGGLVTGLLKYAKEEGLIGGALVTRFKDNPLRPEPYISKTVEDIMESRGSKYCPVSVNTCLRDILEDEDDNMFAFVGLPCHIKGLRKAEIIKSDLKKRIKYRFGLFCHHGVSFNGTKFMLEKYGLLKEKIKYLQYRGDGWPGGIKIELEDGHIYSFLSPWGSVFGLYFYTPNACMFCSDATSEMADLSFGDAWLPEYGQDTLGTSIVISRTLEGEVLLQKATAAGAIKLEPMSPQKVIESQHSVLYFKKRGLSARRILADRQNKVLPQDIPIQINTGLLDIIIATLFMNFNSFLSRNRIGEAILNLMPLKLMRLYCMAVYMLFLNKIPLS
jgi:coenzyme F420 hydrogenase subunit beta